MTVRGSTVYRVVDAAMIRAVAHTELEIGAAWPDLQDADGMRDWIRATWQLPDISDAVWLASPQLAGRIEAVGAGGHVDTEHGQRMAAALGRYLVRARRRPTPFGVFAGVAALRFRANASVTSSGHRKIHVRADASWLAAVVARLEADPDLRDRLYLQTNNLALAHGLRLVVTRRPHASVPTAGTPSVRNTEAVRLVTSIAADVVRCDELIDKVADAFRGFPRSSAAALVADLLRHGVLISCLRPPSTCPDPLGHVLNQAKTSGRPSISGPVDSRTELDLIHDDLGASSNLRVLAARMHRLEPVAQPLAVSLRLPDRVVLPLQVADEVVTAVSVLRQLSPDPAGRPQWRAYRSRFVQRYGISAVVPLTQLLDPVTGLGYPAHFSTATQSAHAVSARDENLLALAQQALIDRAGEVVLDDAAVQALTGTEHDQGHASSHADVVAEVWATSMQALTSGQFTVAVTGIGRSAMATGGRFLDALPEADRDRMSMEFAGLPVAVEDAILAQLSFPPSRLHAENVLNAPQVLPWLIPLAEHRPTGDRVIGIGDLGVAAGQDRLALVSLSQRRVVEPTVAHAGALHTFPLIGRFLVELPRSMDARLTPFDWGIASGLPFRPALRYGRTLLAVARWRIDPGVLPLPQASESTWRKAWEALRAKLLLPRWVQVGSGDQRLRLDLDQPMDRSLMRAHAASIGRPFTVAAAASPEDFGWFSGRAHEVVVPIASTVAPAPAPPAIASGASWPPPRPASPVLPGAGGVVSARLAVEPALMDVVLQQGLPDLLAGWDEQPMIWFLRRRHPAPHLRLRVHTDDFGHAAVRIGLWADALRQQGLSGDLGLDTYHPESGRYGTGRVLSAAERLFATDSRAVLAQLNAHTEQRINRQALTAVSMVNLAAAVLGHRTSGYEWLVTRAPEAGPPPVDRTVLRHALGLSPDAVPEPVLHAWNERSRAAAEYATALIADDGPITPESVLTSLLHLHHIRVNGPDEAAERFIDRLARHIALAAVRRRARPQGAAR